MDSIKISSPAFSSNSSIPDRYTLYGDNVRPELDISNIPASASSLAVILDDPDAVSGLWTHWIVVNINIVEVLKENEVYGKYFLLSFLFAMTKKIKIYCLNYSLCFYY